MGDLEVKRLEFLVEVVVLVLDVGDCSWEDFRVVEKLLECGLSLEGLDEILAVDAVGESIWGE